MADYLYSVAIRANSFHNDMADKMVWRINQVQINEYSLYILYIYRIVGNFRGTKFSWISNIRKNFMHKFSFLEPSAKILSSENFPMYSIFILTIKLMYMHKIICLYECLSMCVLYMPSDLHV